MEEFWLASETSLDWFDTGSVAAAFSYWTKARF